MSSGHMGEAFGKRPRTSKIRSMPNASPKTEWMDPFREIGQAFHMVPSLMNERTYMFNSGGTPEHRSRYRGEALGFRFFVSEISRYSSSQLYFDEPTRQPSSGHYGSLKLAVRPPSGEP